MIRKANINDLDSINDLGLLINDNFNKTYNINDYLYNQDYIILINDEKDINGLLIIYNNIDFYELEIIVVDEKVRNKGIATNLLNYFLSNYSEKDIILEVSVLNKNAINLYKKFDFEIINTRKKYYNGIDAYVMKRAVL